jgi:hypothetical protein
MNSPLNETIKIEVPYHNKCGKTKYPPCSKVIMPIKGQYFTAFTITGEGALNREASLSCHTCCVTGPRFNDLIRKTAHSVASYDTQGNVEDNFSTNRNA